jgi:hypothetical protein
MVPRKERVYDRGGDLYEEEELDEAVNYLKNSFV